MAQLIGATGIYTRLIEHSLANRPEYTITHVRNFIVAGTRTADHTTTYTWCGAHLAGTLFCTTTYQPLAQSGVQRPFNTSAELMKNYWGSYSGAWQDEQTDIVTLIRDPLGLSTLFYYQDEAGTLFANEMRLLYDCLEKKPAFNPDYFVHHALSQNFALRSTPFADIHELPAGSCLTIERAKPGQIHKVWNPLDREIKTIENTAEFEQQLLTTLRACVKAVAGSHETICVELSGGADSSGVLMLLRDQFPHARLIAINYVDSKTSSSNEIEYARDVAQLCNAELRFIDWHNTSLLDPINPDWRPNKPATFLLYERNNEQLREIIESNNAIIINGQGGDHVFLAPTLKESVADSWLARGFTNFSSQLQDIAGVYRMPVTALLADTIKSIAAYYRGTKMVEKTYNEWIRPEHRAHYYDTALRENTHGKKYPGKIRQIDGLHHAIAYSETNQRLSGHTFIHPLLCQPIVELALQIPTYQSHHNGFDRIFFRNAVSKLGTTKALWRRQKGDTSGTMLKSLQSNANTIEQIINNGLLAQKGIIDTQWVSLQLQKMKHGQMDHLWPLLQLLTGQLYIDQWTQYKPNTITHGGSHDYAKKNKSTDVGQSV